MLQTDTDYYRKRAATEREAARNAASPEIASIHEQLARDYDELAERPNLRGMVRSGG